MADSSIKIRRGSEKDFDALARIMYEAVRNGPSRYTESQKLAWVPEIRSGEVWANRLADQIIFVADRGSTLAGFMTLASEGYVDFAYVLPSCQGTGIFKLMYFELENYARSIGQLRLWVHASLMAEPAFRSVDFQVTKQEKVPIGDQLLDRFEMEKHF